MTDYGRKPRVRAQITRLWQQARAAGAVQAVAVRACDFCGPDAANSVLSEYGVARRLAGRASLVPYPANFPLDFTYVPHVARAIVTLAEAPDDACGQARNVPIAPTRTLREPRGLAAKIAGVPMRLQTIPDRLAPLVGIFAPAVRELREMRFQTDRPYRVGAPKCGLRFGPRFTGFAVGPAATVDFYRRSRSES